MILIAAALLFAFFVYEYARRRENREGVLLDLSLYGSEATASAFSQESPIFLAASRSFSLCRCISSSFFAMTRWNSDSPCVRWAAG